METKGGVMEDSPFWLLLSYNITMKEDQKTGYMKYLNEHTMIPLSFFSCIVGFMLWLSNSLNTVSLNTVAIDNLKSEVVGNKKEIQFIRERVFLRLNDISKRLSNIEGYLQAAEKRYDKKR